MRSELTFKMYHFNSLCEDGTVFQVCFLVLLGLKSSQNGGILAKTLWSPAYKYEQVNNPFFGPEVKEISLVFSSSCNILQHIYTRLSFGSHSHTQLSSVHYYLPPFIMSLFRSSGFSFPSFL